MNNYKWGLIVFIIVIIWIVYLIIISNKEKSKIIVIKDILININENDTYYGKICIVKEIIKNEKESLIEIQYQDNTKQRKSINEIKENYKKIKTI